MKLNLKQAAFDNLPDTKAMSVVGIVVGGILGILSNLMVNQALASTADECRDAAKLLDKETEDGKSA